MTSLIDPQTSTNALESLVGEGKKFSDAEALAKGKLEADAFIAQLIKEKREQEIELQKRMTAEELYRQMQNSRNQSNDVSNPQTNAGEESAMKNNPSETKVVAPDPDQIKNLVREAITQESTQALRNRNLTEVKNILVSSIGDNYAQVITEKASELGMSINELDELAAKSPKAFYNIMGLNAQQNQSNSNVGVPPSSRTGVPTQNANVRNEKFYKEMMIKDPKKFFSAEIQQQRWKDVRDLGAKFHE